VGNGDGGLGFRVKPNKKKKLLDLNILCNTHKTIYEKKHTPFTPQTTPKKTSTQMGHTQTLKVGKA